MPPPLASLICIIFILWLLKREVKNNAAVSHAIWIPFVWMSIIGSRFISEWLNMRAMGSPDAYLEGSPIDAALFLALILLGTGVLLIRQVSWPLFFQKNVWITAFFLYTAFSILWSDFPLTAFKRWYKVLGHVILALVVLSEREPMRAVQTLFRRCGYILILLSVLFIKYYPAIGRGFSPWTGEAVNWGVTSNKNTLGNVCMVFGLFFVSDLFVRRDNQEKARRLDQPITALFVYLIGWLANMANSVNAWIGLILGVGVILLSRIRYIYRHFTFFLIAAALLVGILQASFNLKDTLIVSSGRDLTLTGRTELWEALQKIKTNPLIGVGFESFWLGERAAGLWRAFPWRPNQAHNGYYETYLNIGLIGLTLQCGMMLAGYLTIRKRMLEAVPLPGGKESRDLAFTRFSMGFLIALAVYNSAEATFKTLHLSFFIFFLIAIQYPQARQHGAEVKIQMGEEETVRRSLRTLS